MGGEIVNPDPVGGGGGMLIAEFPISVTLIPGSSAFWPSSNVPGGNAVIDDEPIDHYTLLQDHAVAALPGWAGTADDAFRTRGIVVDLWLHGEVNRLAQLCVYEQDPIGGAWHPSAYRIFQNNASASNWLHHRQLIVGRMSSYRVTNHEPLNSGRDCEVSGRIRVSQYNPWGGYPDLKEFSQLHSQQWKAGLFGLTVANMATEWATPIYRQTEHNGNDYVLPMPAAGNPDLGDHILVPVLPGHLDLQVWSDRDIEVQFWVMDRGLSVNPWTLGLLPPWWLAHSVAVTGAGLAAAASYDTNTELVPGAGAVGGGPLHSYRPGGAHVAVAFTNTSGALATVKYAIRWGEES